MAAAAAVAVVAGTAIQLKGQADAASAKKKAAGENFKAKRLQALELVDRSETNIETIRAQGEILKGRQKLTFSSRGIDIGSGAALSVVEETNSQVLRAAILEKRKTDFKVRQLNAQGQGFLDLQKQISSAERSQAFGTFLSGASRLVGGAS